MNYKAYAAKSKFEDADTKNRALLDIGAGSLQISIFDKQNLIQTQNLPIGAVRIRDYLAKYGENMYDLVNGGVRQASTAKVTQGCIESSNINVVSEMVNMITISRAFQAGQKVINAVDETLDKAVNQVGKV